eukprot:m.100965 g.100965  ORF g.100965 m.100965 type:complete len:79 (+) comp37103_c0_seq19:188-424(+)
MAVPEVDTGIFELKITVRNDKAEQSKRIQVLCRWPGKVIQITTPIQRSNCDVQPLSNVSDVIKSYSEVILTGEQFIEK